MPPECGSSSFRAPPVGENHVEKRNPDRQQRQQQRGRRHRTVDGRKPGNRKDQPEERTAGVPEKNPRWMEVVAQEAETCAGQNQHAHRLRRVSARRQEPDRHAARRHDRESGSEPVESVDQVERVQDDDHPADRQRQRKKPRDRPAENRVVAVHVEPDDQCHDDLNRELQLRLQFAAVVHNAERAEQCRRNQQPRQKLPGFRQRRMKRIEAERREKRQNHRNAPAARDRMLMNVPSARLVHIAQARQHTNADPRQQHRQAAAEQRIQHESPARGEKIKRHSHLRASSSAATSLPPFTV